MAPLSQSAALKLGAHFFATVFVGFGVNALIRPTHALTFFEFAPPTNRADAAMVDSLMAVYGIRDIAMGAMIYAAALCGTTKSLGWSVFTCGLVAVADGVVCWTHGEGQWNHWGYSPMLLGVGLSLMGVLDR